jgi:hypothetical protein
MDAIDDDILEDGDISTAVIISTECFELIEVSKWKMARARN